LGNHTAFFLSRGYWGGGRELSKKTPGTSVLSKKGGKGKVELLWRKALQGRRTFGERIMCEPKKGDDPGLKGGPRGRAGKSGRRL